MSSAGKCPRALSAQLLGVEGEAIPDFVMRAAEEGNWHEARIIEKLKEQDNIFDQQLEVVLEYPSFNLIGHIDGKVQDYDLQRGVKLLEIKTMSQYEFDRWMKGRFEAFPNYATQITCYMEATGLDECLYIVKNRSSGYEDRQVLTKKPLQMEKIVNDLAFTEYKKLCLPEPKELTPLEQAELEAVCILWRKAKQEMEVAQGRMDEAKTTFRQHTEATGIDKWSFNNLAIQLVHYKESVTYPKKKLLEVFTEEQLKPASQVKEAYDQLRITDLERGEE